MVFAASSVEMPRGSPTFTPPSASDSRKSVNERGLTAGKSGDRVYADRKNESHFSKWVFPSQLLSRCKR
jgi:hypothetical protein